MELLNLPKKCVFLLGKSKEFKKDTFGPFKNLISKQRFLGIFDLCKMTLN